MNPWAYQSFGHIVATCDAHDRIEKIKKAEDVDWLGRVLKWHDTQKTVRQAAARRISKLLKLHKHGGGQ